MRVASVSAARLFFTVALIEVATGVALFAFPAHFPTVIYAPLAPLTSRMAATLLAGGIILLLNLRYAPRRQVQRWLLAAGAVPLPLLSWIIWEAGGYTGVATYLLLAAALIAAGWTEVEDPFALTLGVVEVAAGLLLLFPPHGLPSPGFDPVRPIMPAAGVLGLLCGGLVLARKRLPPGWSPFAERFAAALPAVLVWNFWTARAWTGVLLWLPLGVAALVGQPVRPLGRAAGEPAGADDPDEQWAEQSLAHVESVTWVLVLLVVTTAALLGDEAATQLPNAVLFVLLLVGFNLVARWPGMLSLRAQVRLNLHLFVAGLAISLMLASPIRVALLPVVPAIPMISARAGGLRRGYAMLGAMLGVLSLAQILLPGSMSVSLPFGIAVGLMIIVLGAAWVHAGHAHRSLYRQLTETSQTLVQNNRVLQAANEELAAQREALAAQQDELLRQHRILVEQAMALSAQRDELLESEERFRTAFEYAPIGVALVDLDFVIMRANPALHDMLGYRRGDLTGVPLRQITHRDDLEEQESLLNAVRAGQAGSCAMEKRYLRHDGRAVWVAVSVALVRDAHGTPRYFVAQVMDVTDRRQAEEQLRRLAHFDPLTDLGNRRYFQRKLEAALDDPATPRGALFFLDFDDFKFVNDTLGHLAGDDLLKNLARVMTETLGGRGFMARLGGDEFGILVPGVDASGAEALAQDLLAAVRSQIAANPACPTYVTISVGIALYPDHGHTAETLMLHADLAMYQAKHSGGDRYCMYVAFEPLNGDEAGSAWEIRLRAALAEDRFTLVFQPILDLQLGEVTQYEALLRMVEPDGRQIPPGEFLPAAASCGLMPEIDRWVVRRAVETIAREQARGRRLTLSVNLSGQALNDPSLVPLVRDLIDRHQIPPGSLRFEVTESAAVTDLDQAAACIEALTDLGCEFALDDFGVGFSSLRYLKRLPVRTLKIDGGFIERLPDDPVDQSLVRSMVTMARGLGVRTVAEYVTSDRALEMLRRCGVDAAQGYYVGPPGPLPEEAGQAV
ncbi:conserved hypothetical protein [Symbiobacterium thermophilum IAM 14863]|uniref:Uncharacterized protein n=1 Tax=Symbiobacterium thermophilum (strain DSM 24528 / JCM 14929 / IAM 14863 / T) TaxID=292459 RepID=Q67RI1_SYMTH|nr:conserved hypothetical protein [Symbiobacterium thermophilum IAM 14863]